MSLHLVELPTGDAPNAVERLAAAAREAARAAGGRVVETSHAPSLGRLYVVVEGSTRGALHDALRALDLAALDLAPVRLVGDPPGVDVPSHLVEWELPAQLGMDQYLKRKAEKTPLYAQVPEVKFLRTYVREDMVKCVCLYDAPNEEAVRRARQVVSAPVDRLAEVAPPSGADE